MEPKKEIITDEMCAAKWRQLLSVFHKLVKDEPEPKEIEADLIALKEAAKNSGMLSPRQMEGISGRCDNYMNGTYGNTKKPIHLSQEHNFSTNGKHP